MSILTYRYRIKGEAATRRLRKMAVAVNQVWNYAGGIQDASRRHNKPRPSGFDLVRLTAGSSKILGLHSDTVIGVCLQFAKSRDKARKRPRWRSSSGAKRSLGWVPFNSSRALAINGDTVSYLGQPYRLWLSREIPDGVRTGCFSEDANGHWYLNLNCEVGDGLPVGNGEVGIDLGLKDLATFSNGEKVAAPQFYRRAAQKIGRAQRAGRVALARKLNRKVAAQRRHFLHEVSTRIVRENALICVGDVNSAKLVRTKMAKSVLDAGWSAFRSMLRYKAIRHGAVFIETDERYSTQTCSCCGAISAGSPRGEKGLRVRTWVCSDCGASHDRDVNAARNILRSGRSVALQPTGTLSR